MSTHHPWLARLALAVSVIIAAVAATAIPVGAVASRRYIVVLHDDADAPAVAASHGRRYGARVSYIYRRAVHGYAATMTSARAQALRRDPSVESVETDSRVRVRTVQWDLDRLDQRAGPLDGSYHPDGDGTGIAVYVIDTGIRVSHHQFGGRAESGYDAVDGGAADDCNGHGTHVAGTIGGSDSGVAKQVRLVAVRVLDCQGQGTTAAVIAGIDWVTANHKPGTPAVANMSLGGTTSTALDRAVRRSITDGITYAVAAGNDGGDACLSSPARVATAITVGAADDSDHKPAWSNAGACVDLFAPGARIRSAWDTSDTATKVLDGTSMASPHVAGVAAIYLQHHPTAPPRTVAGALVRAAVPAAIDGSGALLQVP